MYSFTFYTVKLTTTVVNHESIQLLLAIAYEDFRCVVFYALLFLPTAEGGKY